MEAESRTGAGRPDDEGTEAGGRGPEEGLPEASSATGEGVAPRKVGVGAGGGGWTRRRLRAAAAAAEGALATTRPLRK